MTGKTNPTPTTVRPADQHFVDITAEVCPMTFVRARLALDRLLPGELLLIRLRGEEPRRSVPANAALLGHEILRVEDQPDGTTELLLRHA